MAVIASPIAWDVEREMRRSGVDPADVLVVSDRTFNHQSELDEFKYASLVMFRMCSFNKPLWIPGGAIAFDDCFFAPNIKFVELYEIAGTAGRPCLVIFRCLFGTDRAEMGRWREILAMPDPKPCPTCGHMLVRDCDAAAETYASIT